MSALIEPETKDLSGKTALITGGTTGIGRATAILLASRGAKVLICGRHEAQMEDALKAIRDRRGDVQGVIADLTDDEKIQDLFSEVDRVLGKLDILINNASLPANRLEDYSQEDAAYILRTNLMAYLACTYEALKRMEKQGSGHIVNIGSMSAVVREKGASLYVTAKAAIDGFTEAFRKEVNERGIKVTLIEPGATGTDMSKNPGEDQGELAEQMLMLRAEDVAEAVLFCLTQPERVDVVLMQIRPHMQLI